VYVTSGHETEIRLTLEAAVDLVNSLTDPSAAGSTPTRELLHRHGFTRASIAPAAEIARVDDRMKPLLDRFRSLPDASEADSVEWVNAEIARLRIAPSAVTHDGAPLHIHWTPTTAVFDDQVLADILMALVQELCDHGTKRFGRCAASDCDDLYYDATRNGSRRFCSNPRCASRTHTADHRARQRQT
jgi:predicted RNA-binding Zn ribbon-like protein